MAQMPSWLSEGASDAKKLFFGDPEAIKKAYDEAIGASRAGGEKIKNFLMGREERAQSFFDPYEGMLSRTYGQGIQGPQTPQILSAFGGKR